MGRGKHRTAVIAVVAGLMFGGGIAIADDSIILGTDGPDVLNGTAGPDSIYGRAGDDRISGGAGDDELDGGAGSDQLSGGDGTDAVVYSGSAPVDASLDGVANDGAAGEKDDIKADVEDLYGGDGNDKLTGNEGPNTLDGGAGDDRIIGGGGSDALFGGDGDDAISARDGQIDVVDCGPGNDTATVDRIDVVSNCEQVDYPAVTPLSLFAIKNKKLALTAITPGSRIVITCVTKCGKKAAGSTVLTVKSAKSTSKQIWSASVPAVIRGETIEIGVTAPGASTNCKRHTVSKSLRVKTLKIACTTAAKGT